MRTDDSMSSGCIKGSRARRHATTQCQADTGHQGPLKLKLHGKSEPPKKRSKKHPLSQEARRRNRTISSARCAMENIIREIKIFRILSERYRNRRRRFALRLNLIAALYNLNLLTK
jgi:hypothetical protein